MKTAAYASERSSESSDWMSHGGQLEGQSAEQTKAGTGGIDLLKGAVFAGGMPVRAKLTIGEPNDKYEQEADRVAEQVMGMPDRAVQGRMQRQELQDDDELQMKPLIQREELDEDELQMKPLKPLIQREELDEDELQMKPLKPLIQREELDDDELQMKPLIQREELDEDELQMKPLKPLIQREELDEDELQMKPLIQRDGLDEDELQMKPLIQRDGLDKNELQMNSDFSSQSPVVTASLEERLSRSKGSGSPLSADIRSFMESRFGADFSDVRVHTGSAAIQMNRDVGAQAFAHGQDVFFGAGKGPGKDALTAHELTHVVQQNGAQVAQRKPDKPKKKLDASLTQDRTAQPQETSIAQRTAITPRITISPALSTIQRSYNNLNGMGKARVDVAADRAYSQTTEELETKLGPVLSTQSAAVDIVDEMLSRVKKIVDAWAMATGKSKATAYEQEFGFAEGDKYYGAFQMTATNIKHVFEDQSQPLRKKLKIIYNAVRNNNLSKYLKVAALELEETKNATLAGRRAKRQQVDEGWIDLTKVKTGFAANSGLKQIWENKARSPDAWTAQRNNPSLGRQSLIAQIANEEKNKQGNSVSRGNFSNVMNTTGAASIAGRRDKRYDLNVGLTIADQDTLKRGDVSDLTTAEMRQLYARQGKRQPLWLSKSDKRKFLRDSQAKIEWEQGKEAIEVVPGSATDRTADEFKARLDGGISGSTDLMMHAADHLGLDDTDSLKKIRLALLGWMLSNHDHSFYEIMTPAAHYGAPFTIDKTNPGIEYEIDDNFFPMTNVKNKFKALLTGNQMPTYYLSQPYKDQLATVLQNPGKDKAQVQGDLGTAGVTVNPSESDRYTAEVAKLKETVAQVPFNTNATEDSLKANRLAMQRLMKDPSFRYLVREKNLLLAQMLLRSMIENQYGLGALARVNILTTAGIPQLFIDQLLEVKRYDLERFLLVVKQAGFVRSGFMAKSANEQAFAKVRGSLAFIAVRNHLDKYKTEMVLASVVKTLYGETPLVEFQKNLNAATEMVKNKPQIFDQINYLVDLGIPRIFIDHMTIVGLYDLEQLHHIVANTPFLPHDYSSAKKDKKVMIKNEQMIAHLKMHILYKNTIHNLGKSVSKANMVLAALIRHSHSNAAVPDDFTILADTARLLMAYVDQARTSTSNQLSDVVIGQLSTPTAKDGTPTEEQFWGSTAANTQLRNNTKDTGKFSPTITTELAGLAKRFQSSTEPNLRAQVIQKIKDKGGEIHLTPEMSDGTKDPELLEIMSVVLDVDAQLAFVSQRTKDTIAAFENLSEREKGAIFRYTTKLFDPMGQAMEHFGLSDNFKKDDIPTTTNDPHDPKSFSLATLRYMYPLMKAMQSGLQKLPVYKGGSVYSAQKSGQDLGTKSDDARLNYASQRYPDNSVLNFSWPMSTSKTTANPFAASARDVILEITTILTGRDIEFISDKPKEQEVLFPPGSRFIVNRTESKNNKVWVYLTEI
jgi:hypothetical protein